MLEFLNHPAFIPALFGFVGGIFLAAVIASVRVRLASAAASANQRVASDKISRLKSENSALQTEIATLRSAEARLLKHQGELEAATKSSEERNKEISSVLRATRQAIQKDLKESEKALRKAMAEISPSRPLQPSPPPSIESTMTKEQKPKFDDDLDFVPAENLPTPARPSASPRELPDEEPAAKAELAANAFRAALREGD